MPARQQTFELIPTTLVKAAAKHRPMTSTQVKKAYRKANKAPRVSRAEQRRLDAEELARQKKEYEREQAAAKAKATRDKKAAKALEERELRKKKGLPEPNKSVRASQPRISMFVKKGTRRTWEERDSEAEDSEATIGEEIIQRRDTAEPPPKRVAIERVVEDEFEDLDAILDTEIFEQLESILTPHQSSGVTTKDTAADPQTIRPPTSQHKHLQEGRLKTSFQDEESDLDDSQVLADMANTQLLTEEAKAVGRPGITRPSTSTTISQPHQTDVPVQNPPKSPPRAQGVIFKTNIQPQKESMNTRQPLQNRSINMPPPPIPAPKPVRSTSRAMHNPQEEHRHQISTKPSRIPKAKATLAPSATQDFLENHLDDFFPSPSHQVRELLSEVNENALPSNTQISRELSPNILQTEMPFADLISTQDLMSSQEMQDLETPCPSPQKAPHSSLPPPNPLPFDNLFLSQDFDLTPEDIQEIESTTRAPPPAKIPITSSKPATPPQPKISISDDTNPTPRPKPSKPRFFTENPSQLPQPTEPIIPASPPPPKFRPRFFQEKEDDLLQAAIEQSKAFAAVAQKHQKLVPLVAGKEGESGKGTGSRTLQRIMSSSTDYGDEDFWGCEGVLMEGLDMV